MSVGEDLDALFAAVRGDFETVTRNANLLGQRCDIAIRRLDEQDTKIARLDLGVTTKLTALENGYRALMADVTGLTQRLAKLETPAPAVPKLLLGAVSYMFPGLKWDALLAKKPAVVIINPSSGPGASVSAPYVAQVTKAKAVGAKVLGYVWTDYGKRPVADVMADVNKYRTWYGVTGTFLDEAANTEAALPYYTELCQWLQGTNLVSCLNPGMKTLESYVKIADYVMVAEQDYGAYATRTGAAWELNPAYAGKLWHVVHSCPTQFLTNAVALAKARNAGLLWVTDDVMTNPYDSNPSYLDGLATALA